MAFCTNCGTPGETRFCTNCGSEFQNWGGNSVVPQVTVVTPTTNALKYGEGFTPDSNCSNCGQPKSPSNVTCSLCEAKLD